MTPILKLLPLLQKNQISIYLVASDLKEIVSSDFSEGNFEKIVIMPWND
jgi:hypothetical protein